MWSLHQTNSGSITQTKTGLTRSAVSQTRRCGLRCCLCLRTNAHWPHVFLLGFCPLNFVSARWHERFANKQAGQTKHVVATRLELEVMLLEVVIVVVLVWAELGKRMWTRIHAKPVKTPAKPSSSVKPKLAWVEVLAVKPFCCSFRLVRSQRACHYLLLRPKQLLYSTLAV